VGSKRKAVHRRESSYHSERDSEDDLNNNSDIDDFDLSDMSIDGLSTN
jgi:hypothetical protein